MSDIVDKYNSARLTPAPAQMLKDAIDEVIRLRADNEKLRLELDMLQATVMVPSHKDDLLTIERLNAALAEALDEAAKLRAALKPCVDYFSWNGGLIRDEEYEAAAAALKETVDE